MTIKKLSEAIVVYCCDGDESVKLHANVLAYYLLKIKKENFEVCLNAVKKPGAAKVFKKLLACRTGTLDGESRMVGIDFSAHDNSKQIQKNLDVKHCCKTNKSSDAFIFTVPHSPLKSDILYFDENYVRIRLFAERFDPSVLGEYQNKYMFIQVNDKLDSRIWEIYIEKNLVPKKIKQITFDIINKLDAANYVIIYCTELKIFDYDILLFISNFLKFYYCILRNKLCFDPTTFQELKETSFLLVKCFMFLDVFNLRLNPNTVNCAIKNLSSLTPLTHGPLTVIQGERPKVNLKKNMTMCGPDYVHVIEGTRSLLSTLNRVDGGTESNYLEIITEIEINDCNNEIV